MAAPNFLSPSRLLGLLGINRLQRRSFDAASGGRRGWGAGHMPNERQAVLAARGSTAAQARYLVGNNGHARSGIEAWVSALVGTGIKGLSAHTDPDTRKLISSAFESWTDDADFDMQGDLYALIALAVRRMVVDGECFIVLRATSDGLRLQVLDAEQLDPAHSIDLPGGGRIIAGVEFDPEGRRVAYHFWKERPGIGLTTEKVRVAANDCCHLYRVDVPGQVRGISWLAPVITRLRELDKLHDSQVLRQQIGAMLTGFVVTPDGGASSFTGEQNGGDLLASLEPGIMQKLAPGEDVRFSDPPEIGKEAVEFMVLIAREIAAGLGVPYELLTGDLTSVNYSSIRAGIVEFRRRVEALQYNTIVFQALRPIWRRWITTEFLIGRLAMPGFEIDPKPYLAAKWITPKQAWVDPEKDVKAEVTAIGAGLMSRREAVAARGLDIEALDQEIAADRAREE